MHGIDVLDPAYSAVEESLRKVGLNILAMGKERVEEAKVPVEIVLMKGSTVDEILKTCNDHDFDLVVTSATLHTSLTHLKGSVGLGSVSDMVVHHALCPVLIIRSRVKEKK